MRVQLISKINSDRVLYVDFDDMTGYRERSAACAYIATVSQRWGNDSVIDVQYNPYLDVFKIDNGNSIRVKQEGTESLRTIELNDFIYQEEE